jgi:hypothetical protein
MGLESILIWYISLLSCPGDLLLKNHDKNSQQNCAKQINRMMSSKQDCINFAIQQWNEFYKNEGHGNLYTTCFDIKHKAVPIKIICDDMDVCKISEHW